MDTDDIVELSRELRRRSLDLIAQSQWAMTCSRGVFDTAVEVRLRSFGACARSSALRRRAEDRRLPAGHETEPAVPQTDLQLGLGSAVINRR